MGAGTVWYRSAGVITTKSRTAQLSVGGKMKKKIKSVDRTLYSLYNNTGFSKAERAQQQQQHTHQT
jgi:hypothetical protein